MDMPEGDVDTFHKDGKWSNRIEGHEVLEGAYGNKAEAQAAGREEARARKVEHIIRNLDGTIGARNTYGHDPRDIPG
jgi:hypothetical protein